MASLPSPSTPLLPPLTDEAMIGVWTQYAAALESLPGGPEERLKTLHGLLADVSARLEEQNRSSISQALLEYSRQTDIPVLRSTTRAIPRQSERSQDRAPSLQRSPWDLLSGSSRIGPRLAQKLVVASARARASRTR